MGEMKEREEQSAGMGQDGIRVTFLCGTSLASYVSFSQFLCPFHRLLVALTVKSNKGT